MVTEVEENILEIYWASHNMQTGPFIIVIFMMTLNDYMHASCLVILKNFTATDSSIWLVVFGNGWVLLA